MTRLAWDTLLAEARATHTADLSHFCAFPNDLVQTPVTAKRIGSADLFEADAELARSHPLARAFHAASPDAHWRETYQGSQITDDFLKRFGCYCLIGQGGAFVSEKMSAYVVYMPPGLDYPFHHHPAEEAYLILAGSADFRVGDGGWETLRAGGSSLHKPNQPHATVTRGEALIAYVVWKGDLKTKPVWTDEALR